MVVVRESPRAKPSPDKNSTQWPPKSPFQALLSSPGGRRKWQDRRDGRASPSPRKGAAGEDLSEGEGEDGMDEDEDEDEETLQLQLKAIQAKLKLKKLQLQKGKRDGGGGSEKENSERLVEPPTKATFDRERPQRGDRSEGVEVPLSPTRERRTEPVEPVSPARRRLGLTTDPRAQDVSLKRARDGTYIKRTETVRQVESTANTPKLSFSERIHRSRAEAQEKEARLERLEKNRSTGFGARLTPASTSNDTGAGPTSFVTPRSSNTTDPKRPSSAHQMQTSTKLDHEPVVGRSKSTRSSRPENRNIPRANGLFTHHADTNTDSPPSTHNDGQKESPPGFDPFSSTHLTKRHIPHPTLARTLSGKEIYPLPRLLKEVKAPDYDPPDCESDFVVFAILASKSSPFDQKATHRTSDEYKPQEDADAGRNKFMVLHLCDGEKWEVDCFLFGSAFQQFWKLTPGTLIAILNPGIMPPKGNRHNGAFSLKLGSSEDCILEIGIARDLGYCSSMKKDGSLCGEWVDKRKTEICEFHLNLEIERNRRTRMEVNTMWRSHRGAGSGPGSSGERRANNRGRKEGGYDQAMGKDGNKNVKVHPEYGRLYSMPPSSAGNGSGFGKKSAANLLDAEDSADALHGMSKEEASRKRIADAQRERDLARKLGEMGGGVGAEYLRVSERRMKTTTSTSTFTTTNTNSSSNEDGRGQLNGQKTPYFDKPSASSLGLLSNKAEDQHLSPAKDRKRHFGLGAVSSSGQEAMGWGGARRAGLLQPKENVRLGSPERGQTKLNLEARPGIVRGRSTEGDGRVSPKKRARFALEKGIREPGRESLGVQQDSNGGVEDEDDDGLDIV